MDVPRPQSKSGASGDGNGKTIDNVVNLEIPNQVEVKGSSNSSSGQTKRSSRPSKELAKSKAVPNAPGQRFQCPRCPKNFSRIENLTRHQANRKSISTYIYFPHKLAFVRPFEGV